MLAKGTVPTEDAVPLEGINCPSGGLPADPDTEVRVRNTALRAGSTALQIEEVPMMPMVKTWSLTIRKAVESSGCSSGIPHVRNWDILHAWRATWLISLEMTSARVKKDSLLWKRVGTSRGRGLPDMGWVPSLSNHILTHQHMPLAPMGNHLPQLLPPHSQLYKWMSKTQWRSPANG